MSVERVAEWPASAHFGATPARGVWDSAVANPPPQGSETMARICVIHQLQPISGTSGRVVLTSSSSVASFGGWRILTQNGSTPGVTFAIADGGGSQRVVGTYVPLPGQTTVSVASYESGVDLAILTAGLEESDGARVGYTPNSNGSNLVFGGVTSGGSFSCDGTALVSWLATDSEALDAAGRAAAYAIVADNLKNERDFDTGLSAVFAPEHYFDARDIDWINGTWTDRIGGTVMNRVGNPQRAGVPGRVL